MKDDLINLLTETLARIEESGHRPTDVRWVGDRNGYCLWDEFAALAAKHDYDSGFGGEEVNTNLLVVGDDWWLERHEYDGSEWWEYKWLPDQPESRKTLATLDNNHSSDIWGEHRPWGL